ncbi:MAG: response regulator transcription factor [Paludibacter sp.]|nr:response regulator transcription factor [Paludibacter sp.]
MTEKKIKILLIDDQQIVIDGIKSMLATYNRFEITDTAFNEEDAWIKIADSSIFFDIVIIDICLPGINGIELCHKIKSHNSVIKVLILSMYDKPFYIWEALSCEVDGYILRNCGKNELLRALSSLIDKGSYLSYDILPLIYSDVGIEKSICCAKLTTRETEVLSLILQELTSKEIAERLCISKQTVDTHRIRIMEKTASKSIVGLIKYAIRNKLT